MLSEPDFIPPTPPLRTRKVGIVAGLLGLRRDVLSSFMRESFSRQVMNIRGVGRLALVVNDAETLREVFIARHEVYEPRSPFQQRLLRPVLGGGLFTADGPVTTRRRGVLARLLHPSRIAQFWPLYLQAAEELAARWAAGPALRRVDEELGEATTRVILRKSLGQKVAIEAAGRIARDFTTYQDAAQPVDILYVLGLPPALTSFQGPRARRLARAVRGGMAALTRDWQEGDGGLYGELRQAGAADPGLELDATGLLDETVGLLLAGSETTAKALGWTLWLLAAHPPTLARLRRELAEVLGGRPPAAEDAARLPFLKAVISESLRLYPPVPILSRQARRADRLRDWTLKPGDLVFAAPWLLHRNPRYWEAPDAFRPDRFLGEAAKKVTRFAYIPFSLGPRVCAGAGIGMAELTAFLAVLLQRLEIAPAPGPAPMPRARLTLLPRDGLRLQLAPRLP